MGAVGSAAPWCLTGWADEVEIKFMIDTGCQVTILAASVFEHMCRSDPQMRARLRPCGRRLVGQEMLTLSGTPDHIHIHFLPWVRSANFVCPWTILYGC